MATVTDNVFTEGLSGKLGASLLFRTLRGKTFVTTPARKPDKRKETAAQKNTRTTFRQAAEWAQHALLDPETKAYYQRKAKKLKLPNAYTAALTDYMRKPQIETFVNKDESISYKVKKRDFRLKKVEIVMNNPEKEEQIRIITPRDEVYYFTLAKEEISLTNYLRITDAANRTYHLPLHADWSKLLAVIE